ncbi:MAG: class I SAM-dependent methyltransferase [Acidobacteria bacterium]|nr:class I SAM-dependent methyltransferase [Acidobacteriota bacterium]
MNPVLQRILESKTVRTESGESVPLSSFISPDEGRFLQMLIADVKPKVSLEIGLAFGVSALFLCEALQSVGAERHIVIDPNQYGVSDGESTDKGWQGIGIKNLEEAGYKSLIDFRNAPSHFALPDLLREGTQLDFAFIDGWHTFDYVMLDFFYIDLMLRVGGVVVFDDVNYYHYPSVRKLCRYVITNRAYTVVGGDPTTLNAKGKAMHVAATTYKFLKRGRLPKLAEPYANLGMPGLNSNYLALRKDKHDVLGDGTRGTRRWDFHRDF